MCVLCGFFFPYFFLFFLTPSFNSVGYTSVNLGTHSLRSGRGATCAANRGISDRLIKRHGRCNIKAGGTLRMIFSAFVGFNVFGHMEPSVYSACF